MTNPKAVAARLMGRTCKECEFFWVYAYEQSLDPDPKKSECPKVRAGEDYTGDFPVCNCFSAAPKHKVLLYYPEPDND